MLYDLLYTVHDVSPSKDVSCCPRSIFDAIFVDFGREMEASWHPKTIKNRSRWVVFGSSWGPPGTSWERLGPSSRPPWERGRPKTRGMPTFGGLLGRLGGLLGPSWRPSGPSWGFLGGQHGAMMVQNIDTKINQKNDAFQDRFLMRFWWNLGGKMEASWHQKRSKIVAAAKAEKPTKH